jgi:DNA-binding CsgD family transcriptional regulator
MVMEGRRGGSAIGPVTALGALGRVRVRRGDPEAKETLTRALAVGAGGEMQHLWPPRCGLAELAWLEGHPEDIATVLGAVYEQALAADSRWARGEIGFWLWKAGVIESPPDRAAAPYALQISGQWSEAAALWKQIGCPYEEALALADGDEAELRAAVTIFDGLGARPASSWARARLRERGVDHIPRGPRPATRASPVGLTPRQAEVLALMCLGHDNASIASQLYISRKTAEHHVSAVMAKIGATTRAMVLVKARELGLAEIGGSGPLT